MKMVHGDCITGTVSPSSSLSPVQSGSLSASTGRSSRSFSSETSDSPPAVKEGPVDAGNDPDWTGELTMTGEAVPVTQSPWTIFIGDKTDRSPSPSLDDSAVDQENLPIGPPDENKPPSVLDASTSVDPDLPTFSNHAGYDSEQNKFDPEKESDEVPPEMKPLHAEADALMKSIYGDQDCYPDFAPNPHMTPQESAAQGEHVSLMQKWENWFNSKREQGEAPVILVDKTKAYDRQIPKLIEVIGHDFYSDSLVEEMKGGEAAQSDSSRLTPFVCNGGIAACNNTNGCASARTESFSPLSRGKVVDDGSSVLIVPSNETKATVGGKMTFLKYEELTSRYLFLCADECHRPGEKCTQSFRRLIRREPLIMFRDSVKGWGLHCLRPMKANTFVFSVTGEILTSREFDHYLATANNPDQWAWTVKRNELKEGKLSMPTSAPTFHTRCESKGNISKFANHACAPTLVLWDIHTNRSGWPRVAYTTRADVDAGAELTHDYFVGGKQDADDPSFDCNCPDRCRHPNRAKERAEKKMEVEKEKEKMKKEKAEQKKLIKKKVATYELRRDDRKRNHEEIKEEVVAGEPVPKKEPVEEKENTEKAPQLKKGRPLGSRNGR